MESNFADRDFSKLMYNPRTIAADKSIVRKYPQLGKLPSWRMQITTMDKQKVFRYIIYMYDRNSPFRTKFNDLNKRRIEAAKEAGFRLTQGVFPEDVEEMLKGKMDKINRMIVDFVRHHRSYKYSYLVANEESFYRIMQQVLNGETKQIADMDRLGKQLEETLTEMLNEDNNPIIQDAVLRYIEEERVSEKFRPEAIAEKSRNDDNASTDKEIS